jgi:undecaprenyl-diphosphatase
MNTIIIICAKYLIIIPIIAVIIWFIRLPRHEKKQAFFFGLITLPLAYIFAKIAGHFYFDARPFVVGNFTPLIPHAADNGFPSDHTLLAGALAASVMCSSRKFSIALWIIAILIGISRVAAGIHHWGDIAGSIVIVLLAALIAHLVLKRR